MLIRLSVLFILLGCHQKTDRLTIAVASNMQFATKKLVESFTKKTNLECNLIINSSGKLMAQIQSSAPFDIFLSADMKYPMTLFECGLTTNKPVMYARGKLALWTMNDINLSINSLTHDKVMHIALANPKTAPYGRAAIEALKHHKIFEIVKNKLVYGESIAQTNLFIMNKSVHLGFTAKSVILSSKVKNKGTWIDIDTTSYSPIKQGIVLLKNREKYRKEAQLFYNFLFSKEGKNILNRFGYGAVEGASL